MKHQKSGIVYWFKAVLTLLLFSLLVHTTALDKSAAGEVQKAQDPSYPQKSSSNSVIASLTKEEQAWLRKHPVIRVVQDPDWPPVEFVDEKGNLSGISGDYLNIVEEKLGLKFERVRSLSWQEAYARLLKREIDMTTSVAVTNEREKFWAFTKPYMKSPIVIVTHTDITYIDDMRELAGKKVAVVEGYAVNDWIPKDFPDIELVRVKNIQEGLNLLQRKKVFAYMDSMLAASYYLSKLKRTDLKIAGETPYVNAQCMAVRLDWAPLAGILQKALASISESRRAEIYRKWLPIRYEHGFDYSLLRYALITFALILSGFIAWNWKLGREIRLRKSAEAALRNNEEKFRLVFEAANVGKSITLPSGEIQVNQAFCDMLGYTQEELKNKKWQELTHPDEVADNENLIDLLLQGKRKSLRVIKRYRHKNGCYVWADVSIALQRDAGQKPLFLITTIIDVTERKLAQEELRSSEERFRTTMQNMIEGVQIIGFDWRYKYFNDAAVRQSGKTREELLDKTMMEAYPGIENTGLFNLLKECLEKRIPRQTDNEFIYPDGTRRWFYLSIQIIPEGVFILSEDITERKQAEEALRRAEEEKTRSEKHYRSLFENSLHGISYIRILYDQERATDYIYVDVNKAFESLTGLKDVIGKKVSEVLPGLRKSDQNLIDFFGKIALTGVSEKFEIYVEALKMWFSAAAYSPQKEYVIAVFDVINDRKRAEAEIRALNENLEKKIAERTAELQERNAQLATLNRVFVDRELKMVELKERIAELEREMSLVKCTS